MKLLSNFSHNIGHSITKRWNWLTKKIRGFRRHVSKYGLHSAFRKVFRKLTHAFAVFMSNHSSGSIKKFYSIAAKKGYLYAVRKVQLKIYQRIGIRSPLVSFILPVYNVEQFLPQCLDTLVQQTMNRIEIICVDDGSTDHSLEILNSYAAKDHRIKVFSQKNQFAGAARNLGLSKANGEYVVFLDSDDFFEKDLAQCTYTVAKENRADVIIYNAAFFDNVTKQPRKARWLFNQIYVPKKQPFNRLDCADYLFQITTPAPWTKMFRRKFILDNGLQFQRLRNSNDVFFTYSALALAERIVTLNKPLVYYRVGLTNNLQSTKKKDPLCFFEACQAVHDKLIELGFMDILRRSYVNAALNNCMYNLNSVSDPDAKQIIYDKLRNGGLEQLEVFGHDSNYYLNLKNYLQAKEIIDAPLAKTSDSYLSNTPQ